MKLERTLSIIKPDILKRNKVGAVISKLEDSGLKIIKIKIMLMDKTIVEKFYHEHRGKPFFSDLTNFMTSGPVIVQVLEGEDAVKKNREIMGNTNPKLAKRGTIRHEFAFSIDENSIHGSDSLSSARREIEFFFKKDL